LDESYDTVLSLLFTPWPEGRALGHVWQKVSKMFFIDINSFLYKTIKEKKII
jgi:hypothetical protein